MVEAYERLASQWAEDTTRYTVVRDAIESPALQRNTTIWRFGPAELGNLWARALPPGVSMTAERWPIAGTVYDPTQHSLVMSAAHPADPTQTVNWLIASDPQWVPVISRKLGHYGKYSYLIFAADAVVAKGLWPVTTSPMRRVIRDE